MTSHSFSSSPTTRTNDYSLLRALLCENHTELFSKLYLCALRSVVFASCSPLFLCFFSQFSACFFYYWRQLCLHTHWVRFFFPVCCRLVCVRARGVHKRHFNKWNASCFHFILILVIRSSFVVVAGISADVFNSFVLVSVKVHWMCVRWCRTVFFLFFFFFGSYSWHRLTKFELCDHL